MKKTIFHFQLIIATLIIALCGTFSCSKGGKQPVEKQAVAPIDTVFASLTDSLEYLFNNANLPLFDRLCICRQLSYELSTKNIEKSIYYAQKCLKLSEKEKIDSITVKLKKTLVYDYAFESTDSSKMYLNELLVHALKNKDEELESWVYTHWGGTYTIEHNYMKAIEYYEKAMRISEKIGNYKRLSSVYGDISRIYFLEHNDDMAEKYILKAIEIMNTKIDNPPHYELAWIYFRFAMIRVGQNRFDEALAIFQKALFHAKAIDNKSAEATILSEIAKTLSYTIRSTHSKDINRRDSAIAMVHRAVELRDSVLGNRDRAISLGNLGTVYLYTEHYSKAKEYLLQALELIEPDDLVGKESIIREYIEASIMLNDKEEAVTKLEQLDSITAAIHNRNVQETVSEMQVKYETEKKQHIIDRQNMQLGLLAGGVAVSIAILVLLWYMLRLRNRRNSALTERNDALAEMNATKDKFFSIISHDLKNPALAQRDALQLLINNARSWNIDTLTDYYHELLKSADGQVELLYNLLNWAQVQTGRMAYTPATFTLSDLLSDTALIRNMANSKGITLILPESQNALITGDRNMLSTVIRNLLTNAIKFTPAGGTVTLDISPNSGDTSTVHRVPCTLYRISVTDTGVGMNVETGRALSLRALSLQSRRGTAGEQGSGLGLIVCKELLEKHSSELHVESEEGKGSKFWFTISSSI